MADRQYHIKMGGNAGASVDAYLEYKRIVGDDDGGQMFSPEEYENYKKNVIPMSVYVQGRLVSRLIDYVQGRLRIKNRLYTSYSNPAGMDCKLVGPETPCFCTHRYKQHKTDFEEVPSARPIHLPCQVKGCLCRAYHYCPLNGSQSIRCTCKHLADEHSAKGPFVCKRGGCTKCTGFKSCFTCACGNTYNDHRMIVETADEREARGHPLGESTPYQAMGGITGFSSLADGYLRLDPSGRGAPSEEFLNQPITASDNPFLRANVNSIKAHHLAQGKGITGPNDALFEDIEERVSSVKKPGESDMDFYERRYQERLKLEAKAKRNPIPNPYTQASVKVGTRKSIEASSSRTKSGKSSLSKPGSSKN